MGVLLVFFNVYAIMDLDVEVSGSVKVSLARATFYITYLTYLNY